MSQATPRVRVMIALVLARPLTPALAMLALCPPLAACGDSDRLSAGDYRGRLSALEKREEKAHRDVEKAFSATTVSEIKTRLSRFADDQEAVGDEVEGLKPPEDAEPANAQLASGSHQLADEIRAVVKDLPGARNPKAALRLVDKRLSHAAGSRKLDQALTKLKKLGYTKSG